MESGLLTDQSTIIRQMRFAAVAEWSVEAVRLTIVDKWRRRRWHIPVFHGILTALQYGVRGPMRIFDNRP